MSNDSIRPEPVVELSNVTFRYEPDAAAQPALDDVSLRVEQDDFLGVIGPNGGGKTTLLKVVLGLVQPQKGTVRVFGRRPAEARGSIGYVPQHAKIDPTVPANVLDVVLTGRLSRSSWGPWFRSSDVAAARAALQQTETEDLAKRPLATLSGGQRQRVLIARALAGEAKLLLLDEPTAGVDPHMEHGLIDLLHRLNQRVPIVIVSHDVSFVSSHLKRVACLNRRLTCHAAADVSREVITAMYDHPVRMMQHVDECALADPGCEHGCSPADAAESSATGIAAGQSQPPSPTERNEPR